MDEKDFIDKITKEWSTIIETVEVDGWYRPIDQIKTNIVDFGICHLNFLLEDMCKDDKFLPIDNSRISKLYRRWGHKTLEIFEDILGDKEDTIPNSSFTEFKFRSGWGISIDYSTWRMSIVFNIQGMMAKQREIKIDNLFK
jgi:hypothetical protein